MQAAQPLHPVHALQPAQPLVPVQPETVVFGVASSAYATETTGAVDNADNKAATAIVDFFIVITSLIVNGILL